jgi:hypothetical protein
LIYLKDELNRSYLLLLVGHEIEAGEEKEVLVHRLEIKFCPEYERLLFLKRHHSPFLEAI